MSNHKSFLDLVNQKTFYDIEKYWLSIELSDYINFDRSINGLYALHHDKYKIIYIGKGKPIFNRLKSHFKATQGLEKSPCWKQFFEHKYFNSNLIAYYFKHGSDNNNMNSELERFELEREVLEKILQIKYTPLFDRMYPKRNRFPVNDFEARIDKLTNHKS